MKPTVQIAALILAGSLGSAAFADVSTTLGGAVLGFDEISRFDNSDLHREARSIIRGYATDVGMTCGPVEVFYKDSGVMSFAMNQVENAVGYNEQLRELRSDFNETIFVVYKQYGSDVIGTLIRLDGGGFVLIVC